MMDGHTTDLGSWLDWAYKGVDHSFTGNGGPECRDFLSIRQRWIESIVASAVSVAAIVYSWPRMKLPQFCPCNYRRQQEMLGKRILLVVMSLTFGIELGFKFATRQMIWLGNPCHIVTIMQIFILAAPPGRAVAAVFRLHMHMLNGAPMAILFPVINTRLLPFETGVYFVQHILMLIIPMYLLRSGDPFIPEALGDFKWGLTSLGLLFIYHFVPLQLLAYASQVNLNSMLCPAVSDPFHGPFYRIFGIGHQTILILTFGKALVLIARALQIIPGDISTDAANVRSCGPDCTCHSNWCCLACKNKEICPAFRKCKCVTDCDSDSGDIQHAQRTIKKLKKDSETNFHHSECSPFSGNFNPSCSNICSNKPCVCSSIEFSEICYEPGQFPIQRTDTGNFIENKVEDVQCCRRRL